MAASAVNSLGISRLLDVHVRTDKINREKIVVPVEIGEEIKDKEEAYDERVNKKTIHAANLADKIKSKVKKGELSQTEKDRRANLTQAMKETRVWINGADTFFVNCKGKGEVTSFLKKVESDYKKLNKNGYINDPTKIKYDKFDRTAYLIDKKKNDLSYGQIISNTYKEMYEPFETLLKKYDDAFKKQEGIAKETRKDFTKKMENIKTKADKVLEQYEHYFETVTDLVESSDTKDDPKLTAKMNELIPDYKHNLSQLTHSVNSIAQKNFTALFLHLFEDLKTIRNMEAFPFYSEQLNEFYDLATSVNYSVEDLKNIYNALMEVKGKLEDILYEFTNQNSPTSKPSSNKLTKKIVKLEEKIEKIYEQIKNTIREFEKQVAIIKGLLEEYKKEKSIRKRRKILFWIFAALGILSSVVAKIYPLIDGALFPVKSPIEPMD